MHTYSRSALVLLTLLLGTSVASAWTGPTQSPPNGNVSAPVNIGSTGQSKNGYLGINESSTPVFPFEVNGSSLLSGSVVLNGSNLYLNFGGSGGSNGYGIRDSGGTMQYKNSSGVWTTFGSGSSQWTSGTNNTIYYSNGYVGVDGATPQAPLTVGNGIGLYGSWPTVAFNNYWTSNGWINYQSGYSGLIQVNQTSGSMSFYVSPYAQSGTVAPVSDAMDIAANGNISILRESNPVNFTSSWSNTTASAANVAEISNDTGTYKTLMIVGNRSGNGSVRSVSVWDQLNVNGSLCLNGSCLSSWPSNTDTLDTVTGRGNSTQNYITVGAVTVNGDWFRMNGSNGIYWNTWQGGWYMSDGTWVRSVNGKNVYTAGQMRADGGFCIGSSCITSWPSSYNNTDTLDTVTGRGNTTSNWVAVGNLTVNQWAGESVEINSNQVWNTTNGHVLYLNWSNANGSVAVGGQSGYTNQLSVYGPEWVRDGATVGGALAVTGSATFNGNVTMQNNLNLNGNQMWTTSGNLYLNYSNSGGAVNIGNTTNNNNNLYVYGSSYANAYYYNSDQRLKTDIQPITGSDALSKVLALQPVTYLWKEQARGAGTQVGFIAQQVQAVVPEIVHTDASTTLESVDYARVTPLLVGSVQEQQNEIDSLKQTIQDQQAEINELISITKNR